MNPELLLLCYNNNMSENTSGADNQQERFLVHPFTSEYVVGLVDGEGYFSVTAKIRERKNYRAHEVSLVFGMKLSEKDGKVLEFLRDYFGCGNLHYCRDLRENFCNCIEYQVRSQKDVLGIIIPFFRKYPLKFPSKQKAFKYFCEIADIVIKRKHLDEKGIKKIQHLSKLMH